MLNQATYSCVLLLDGNIVDLSEVVHSGRTSSASATCSFTLTSRWTVKFQDSRRADSIGSVHVNGEYLGAWSFKGTTDTGSGSPTVSGVVGVNSSTLDEPILIRLSILGKPFKSDPAAPDEEPVVFCFTMVQAKGPRTIYSTCDPKQAMPVPSRANRAPTLPMSSHSSTSPDVPTSYFQGHTKASRRALPLVSNQLHSTTTQPFELSNRLIELDMYNAQLHRALKKEQDAAAYFELSVSRLYDRMPPVAQVRYLHDRLTKEDNLSPAVRVSVAIARRDTVRSLNDENRSAILGEVSRIKALFAGVLSPGETPSLSCAGRA